MLLELLIQELGANGDGIAIHDRLRIFVAFALPGETVQAAVEGDRGQLVKIIEPSSTRRKAICGHHGSCGSCSMQHMHASPYLAHKHSIIARALEQRGIETSVEPMRAIADASRRRATLTCRRNNRGMWIGYRKARSNELIDIKQCPVLEPRLLASLDRLKSIMAPLMAQGAEARLTVTRADNGLDVEIEPVSHATNPDRLQKAIAEAAKLTSLLRITANGQLLHFIKAPEVRFGKAVVHFPPGAFLQATKASEAIMTALVLEGVGDARRALDLFSGLGTFTFPLAERAPVTAVEGSRDMVAAVSAAAARTQGIRPVTAICRDLDREPFVGMELDGYDAVIFDPPRAGAHAQAMALAASKIPRIVAVSCDPGTLARDLRVLIDGGYHIRRVTPIDQFVYSHHLEVVAVLERAA